VVQNPSATLDGKTLDVGPLVSTGVYTIPVGDTSLIKTVDPTFPSAWTETRVASSAWLMRLTPLTPGEHTLVLADTINDEPFVATFRITVTAH
jgi:hypothetical protein